MKPVLALTTLALFMGPADVLRAGASGPVLEIVSFRLNDGVTEPAFLEAAADTEALLRARGTLVRRTLVRDDKALWTDVIEWISMEAAMSAADDVMRHQGFARFGAMIDGDSVEMRHATIRWRMD